MNFQKILKEIETPLSGEELLEKFERGKEPSIILYKDLINYENLDDILGPNKKCILMYQSTPTYGHWCCVYINPRTKELCYFDSYGNKPDEALNFIPQHMNDELKQYHKYLTILMLDWLENKGQNSVVYNEKELQSQDSNNVTYATCGRWCVCRLKFPGVSVEEFYDIFQRDSKKYDICKDGLVTLIWNQF